MSSPTPPEPPLTQAATAQQDPIPFLGRLAIYGAIALAGGVMLREALLFAQVYGVRLPNLTHSLLVLALSVTVACALLWIGSELRFIELRSFTHRTIYSTLILGILGFIVAVLRGHTGDGFPNRRLEFLVTNGSGVIESSTGLMVFVDCSGERIADSGWRKGSEWAERHDAVLIPLELSESEALRLHACSAIEVGLGSDDPSDEIQAGFTVAMTSFNGALVRLTGVDSVQLGALSTSAKLPVTLEHYSAVFCGK